VKPEDIERLLIEDAAGITASAGWSARVMSAVRREAETPPPIPFPWQRAWPGIAAMVCALAGSWLAAPSLDTIMSANGVSAVSDWARTALASVDPVWLAIALVVGALTLAPIAVPFWLVSYRRGS
jgi:hypothetical protein